MLDEISRYSPSEIIVNKMLSECSEEMQTIKERFDVYISNEDEEKFSTDTDRIYREYALSDDKGNIVKDLEKRLFAVSAINGLITYIEDTQKNKARAYEQNYNIYNYKIYGSRYKCKKKPRTYGKIKR